MPSSSVSPSKSPSKSASKSASKSVSPSISASKSLSPSSSVSPSKSPSSSVSKSVSSSKSPSVSRSVSPSVSPSISDVFPHLPLLDNFADLSHWSTIAGSPFVSGNTLRTSSSGTTTLRSNDGYAAPNEFYWTISNLTSTENQFNFYWFQRDTDLYYVLKFTQITDTGYLATAYRRWNDGGIPINEEYWLGEVHVSYSSRSSVNVGFEHYADGRMYFFTDIGSGWTQPDWEGGVVLDNVTIQSERQMMEFVSAGVPTIWISQHGGGTDLDFTSASPSASASPSTAPSVFPFFDVQDNFNRNMIGANWVISNGYYLIRHYELSTPNWSPTPFMTWDGGTRGPGFEFYMTVNGLLNSPDPVNYPANPAIYYSYVDDNNCYVVSTEFYGNEGYLFLISYVSGTPTLLGTAYITYGDIDSIKFGFDHFPNGKFIAYVDRGSGWEIFPLDVDPLIDTSTLNSAVFKVYLPDFDEANPPFYTLDDFGFGTLDFNPTSGSASQSPSSSPSPSKSPSSSPSSSPSPSVFAGSSSISPSVSSSVSPSSSISPSISASFSLSASPSVSRSISASPSVSSSTSRSLSASPSLSASASVSPSYAPDTIPHCGVREDFNKPDGGLGGSWTASYGQMNYASNVAMSNTSYGASYWWNSDTFGPGVETYLTLGGLTTTVGEMQFAWNYNQPTGDAYSLKAAVTTTGATLTLSRMDAGAPTTLDTATITYASRVTLGLLIEHDENGRIALYIDVGSGWQFQAWDSGLRISDSTYQIANSAFIEIYGAAPTPWLTIDNWGACTIFVSASPSASASGSLSPSSSGSPSKSASVSPSVSSSKSPSVSPSKSPSSSKSPSVSPSKSPSSSPSASESQSISPSASASPSALTSSSSISASVSPSVSASESPSISASVSRSISPSSSPSASKSPSASFSISPSASKSPSASFSISSSISPSPSAADWALDDFNRTTGLGSNWSLVNGDVHLTEAETGNYRLRHLHTADSAWLYWNANTFTDDQFVEAQVYPSQFGGSVLLWARTDGTLSNGYLMGISSAASLITFYYASSAFYFSLHASYSATIIGGDYARFEVSGQTPNIQLRGYINDVLVATLDEVDFTSSQIFGSGTVGLVIPYTDFVEQAVDNFRAGITTSGVSPSISPSESTSRSVSPSISRSVSPSVSPSLSPSSSVSPSISQSLSVSQSSSISRSESPSISASHSVSASTSRSKSPSSSPSASPSPSAAVTIHYGPRVQFT